MGIGGGLIKKLTKKATDKGFSVVEKNIRLSVFAGCTVAVDVSIYAYQFSYGARCNATSKLGQSIITEDLDEKEVSSSILYYYYGFMKTFLEDGVNLVLVFDGKPHNLKKTENESRDEIRKKRKDKISSLRQELQEKMSNPKLLQLQKAIQANITFVADFWTKLKDMAIALGITVVTANGVDAEAVCAKMCVDKKAIAIASNDSDSMVFGAPMMLRNIKRRYERGRPAHHCEVMFLSRLLAAADMSYSEFVDFSILMGTDYNKNYYRYSYATVWKLFKEQNCTCIEDVQIKIAHKVKDYEEYDLSDPDKLSDIRKAFVNNFEYEGKNDPIMLQYDGMLRDFIEENVLGWPKSAMLAELKTTETILNKFPASFLLNQKIVFDIKDEQDSEETVIETSK